MNLQALVSQVESLFSLPEIALRINEELNKAEPCFVKLEEIIISDPAFTAKLLNIVNSAYFGFPSSIDTVSRALTIIGIRELRNLVITTSVTTSFKGIPVELVDMDVFWYHSITSGVIAKLLAKKLKQNEYERFYIIGLLHSIGKLIYFSQCPDLAREILVCKDQGEEAIIAAEEDLLGFNYAQLSAEFLHQWNLPTNIYQVILHHLDPLVSDSYKQDACILHVAGKIAASIEPCAKYDFDYHEVAPCFDPGVIQYLKLTPNQIQYCIDTALDQAFDILSIISPKATMIF